MAHTHTQGPPDALLLLGTHCPHCPAMLEALGELTKAGAIGRLEVVNVEQHPEAAEALGIRSVPWVRLGPFELAGLRSRDELSAWAAKAGTAQGFADYVTELLAGGRADRVVALLRGDPAVMKGVRHLLADPDTDLTVRIGIGVIMEELEGDEILRGQVEALGRLTGHPDPRVRIDACHYLGLTRAPEAVAYIRPLIDDPDRDVREVASDSLATLGAGA